jgi:hypothetical protein
MRNLWIHAKLFKSKKFVLLFVMRHPRGVVVRASFTSKGLRSAPLEDATLFTLLNRFDYRALEFSCISLTLNIWRDHVRPWKLTKRLSSLQSDTHSKKNPSVSYEEMRKRRLMPHWTDGRSWLSFDLGNIIK